MFRHSVRFAITLSLVSVAVPLALGTQAAAQETPAPKTPATVASQATPAMQALLADGNKALAESRTADALRLFEQALATARTAGDKAGESKVLSGIGFTYRNLGQWQKMLDSFQQALPLSRQIGDKQGEAVALNLIGFAYFNLGQMAKALDLYQEALVLYRQTGNKPGEAQVLIDLGFVYRNLGQWQNYLDCQKQILTLTQQLGDKQGEAVALNLIGFAYFNLGQTAKALDLYQQALALFRQIGDKPREAQVLVDLGFAYRNLGQWQKDLDCAQQALTLAQQRGDKQGEVSALGNLGGASWNLGQPQKALDYFQQALIIAQQTGDKSREAETFNSIGSVYYALQQGQKAIDYWQQALPLFQQLGNKQRQILPLYNLGYVYEVTVGQPQKARDYYQQVLTLAQQTGDKPTEVNVLNSLGALYWKLGQPQKVLDAYQKALAIARQTGDKQAEASALFNIGDTYWHLGQPYKVVDFYQQVVALRQQTGDKRGEGTALGGIAGIYNNTGQPQKAWDAFQQLLTITQQLGDKTWESNVLNNLALVARGLNQPQKVMDTYQKALAVARQTGNTYEEADILYGIALVYLNQGQTQEALDCCQQVLVIAENNRDTTMAGAKFNSIGDVYFDLGQTQKALDLYQKALPIRHKNGDKQEEANVLANLGRVYRARKRYAESEAAYRQSLAQYEQIRTNLNLDAQTRALFLERYLYTYQGLLATLLDQSTPAKTEEAFALSQQMKGRSLTEMLAGRATINAQLTPEEQTKLRELRAVCDRLNVRIVAEGVTNEVGSRNRSEELRKELATAERVLSVFSDQLYTRYAADTTSPTAPSVSATQVADTLPIGTALIEFVSTNNSGGTAVFVTSHKEYVEAFTVALPPGDLATAVAALRSGVVDPRGNGQAWKAPARTLYDALLSPLEKAGHLKGVSRLVLCPTGPLWDVPFATLLDAQNSPLLSRFTLTQAQSATLYVAAQDRVAKQASTKRAKGLLSNPSTAILAVADPAFAQYKSGFGNNPALPGQRPLPAPDRPLPTPDRPLPAADRPLPSADRDMLLPESLRGGRLSALPGTRREADAIRGAFPRASVFIGSQAQESVVKQLAPKSRFLHLATHGFVNDTSPLLSSLVLAEPPKTGAGSSEDGFLTARELLDLDLSNVEMTVLSACNTARGQNQRGEGVVGLTWALFAAGCPTQVLSQWAVNDASTATLMEQFYANLKAGKPKAEALRQAALTVSGNPATAHPYYWAPFVLFGSGD